MPDRLPFCQIKLQLLHEMAADPNLDDQAFRVAAYLALAHADHQTGESRPTFETIGAAVGKHAKSVRRALNNAEATGYLEIARGTNRGNASRYRPTTAALERATARRREGDKIVPLSRARGGQTCPDSGTEVSRIGGQICPPNKDQEFRTRPLIFVAASSKGAETKAEVCDKHLGQRLSVVVPEVISGGERGFLLPGRWPPVDRREWPAVARFLRSLNGEGGSAAHG